MQQLTQKQVEQMQLKYYNSDVHQAAFVLPEFARKVSRLRAGEGRGTWGLLRARLSPGGTQRPPEQAFCPTRP